MCVCACVSVCVCVDKNINKIWEWPCPLFLEHRLSTLYVFALTRGITVLIKAAINHDL